MSAAGRILLVQLQKMLAGRLSGRETVGGLLVHRDSEADRSPDVAVPANCTKVAARSVNKVCIPEGGP